MSAGEQPSGPGGPGPSGGNQRSRVATGVSWGVTLFLVALVALVVVYGITRKTEAPPRPVAKLPNVEVRTVQPRPYRETLVLPCVLKARREAAVAPEIGGRLARWLVDEGAKVEAGQVVAELDTEALRARRAELTARRKAAEAGVEQAERALESARLGLASAENEVELRRLALESARSTLELARSDHARVSRLVEAGVLDRARLDAAENALTQAEVGLRQAEKALEAAGIGVRAARARFEEAKAARHRAGAGIDEIAAAIRSLDVQIAKARLRAPVPGVLEVHLAEPGEVVAAGVPLARIYDLGTLKAVVNVPDRFVAFLRPDNPATAAFIRQSLPGAVPEVRARVLVPGLPKLTGEEAEAVDLAAEVVRVAHAADPESATFEVELRIPNPGGALRQGIIGRARIEYLTYPEAIVIPMKAVQVTDEGPRVLVVERENGRDVARVRPVVPASIGDDRVLVLSGLGPGDRLVVAGWKGVVSGEPVRVVVEDGAVVAAKGEARQ